MSCRYTRMIAVDCAKLDLFFSFRYCKDKVCVILFKIKNTGTYELPKFVLYVHRVDPLTGANNFE